VAVNARNEIAVTDNHRVQFFNSEGNYLRSFGRKGNKAGAVASKLDVKHFPGRNQDYIAPHVL